MLKINSMFLIFSFAVVSIFLQQEIRYQTNFLQTVPINICMKKKITNNLSENKRN